MRHQGLNWGALGGVGGGTQALACLGLSCGRVKVFTKSKKQRLGQNKADVLKAIALDRWTQRAPLGSRCRGPAPGEQAWSRGTTRSLGQK